MRQQPPDTPRAQPVQHGVHQLPAVVHGWAATRFGRRDQRRQQRPLRIGQVGRVAATRRSHLYTPYSTTDPLDHRSIQPFQTPSSGLSEVRARIGSADTLAPDGTQAPSSAPTQTTACRPLRAWAALTSTRSLATHGALRLEFDFLDVVVAADGTPYASLVDGCTAEERHSRPGQGIVGHLVSGPPLVGTAGEQRPRVTLPRRCRRPLRNPAAGATVSSVGKRLDLRQRPEGAYGARPPAPRANPARPPCARPGPGHDCGPDEHRADGGAHAPLSDVRALSTEHWALSQAAPLSRLRG